MLRNYFKILWRSLLKNKGYTFINILGLTIGMAAALLIILWMQNELSMDRFYEKGDRTYIMFNRTNDPSEEGFAWSATPKIMGPTLKSDYSEVESFSRFNPCNFLFSKDETKLKAQGSMVDSAFLEMFSFKMIAGNPKEALNQVHQIVLTKDFATSLFGKEDPMGKTVKIDSTHLFTVTGILENPPSNSSFQFKYLLPWKYLTAVGWDDQSWGNNSIRTYVTLKPGTSQAAFDQKIQNITIDHVKNTDVLANCKVFTQSVEQMYLYNKSDNGHLVAGNLVTVQLFGVIATFILLIACINFMNLSTARSEKRAKEVGIRKVVGVTKKGLIFQFILESVFLSLISFLIAILIVALALPAFSVLVRTELHIPFDQAWFWMGSTLFILITGLLAGSYPAFYLSSFNPVKVLKGTFQTGKQALTPRKILVTFQFTFAIILIISTIIIAKQIRYGLDRDQGYDQAQIIFADYEGNISKHYDQIRNELISSQAIQGMTRSVSPITETWRSSWGYAWTGSTNGSEKIQFNQTGSDADFVKTIGGKLIAGRDINIYDFPTDSMAVLLNESAVKIMNLKDPIGARVYGYTDQKEYYTVVGVVNDFIIDNPFDQKIQPLMVLGLNDYNPRTIHLKVNNQNGIKINLDKIKQVFEKYNPDYPFDYSFVDQVYAKKFHKQEQTATLVTLFMGMTIFISCLGLFGLATYMAENRTKEIGIRKVLGASVANVTQLLTKEFLLLVLLAVVIASPIAWFIMNQWLANFSYRTEISWWIFPLTAALIFIISLLTVSWQAIKAALMNPVKSLRNE